MILLEKVHSTEQKNSRVINKNKEESWIKKL